jgi:hypothetical protein
VPLPHHLAIVSLTKEVSTRDLLLVTAALQKQVTRDFSPIWGFPATVDAFEDLHSIPNDYHPVAIFKDPEELAGLLSDAVGAQPAARLIDEFERENVAGIHLNALTRQPFALVEADEAWTVVLSHEVLEMLADPWGNHIIAAAHPTDPRQRVKYLIEICDPCQSCWYPVNGIPVSDFYTPRYFDPVRVDGIRYSFTGALKEPRKLLPGGYLTFLNPRDSLLYQWHYGEEQPHVLADLETLARSGAPLRTLVDANPGTPRVRADTLSPADSAYFADTAYLGVTEASHGSALCTAEVLYSLATGVG